MNGYLYRKQKKATAGINRRSWSESGSPREHKRENARGRPAGWTLFIALCGEMGPSAKPVQSVCPSSALLEPVADEVRWSRRVEAWGPAIDFNSQSACIYVVSGEYQERCYWDARYPCLRQRSDTTQYVITVAFCATGRATSVMEHDYLGIKRKAATAGSPAALASQPGPSLLASVSK
jgi:hypothetical protein